MHFNASNFFYCKPIFVLFYMNHINPIIYSYLWFSRHTWDDERTQLGLAYAVTTNNATNKIDIEMI